MNEVQQPDFLNFSEQPPPKTSKEKAIYSITHVLANAFRQSTDSSTKPDMRYFVFRIKEPQNVTGMRIDSQVGVVSAGDRFVSSRDNWDSLPHINNHEQRYRGLPRVIGRENEKNEEELVLGANSISGSNFENSVLSTTSGTVALTRYTTGNISLQIHEPVYTGGGGRHTEREPTDEEYLELESIFTDAQMKMDEVVANRIRSDEMRKKYGYEKK